MSDSNQLHARVAPVRAVHVPALVAVEGAQLGAVVDEGARDGGRVGAAPLQLGEEHARVEVVQLLQVAEDGRGGLGRHAQLVPATWEWVVLLSGTIPHMRGAHYKCDI